MPYIEKTGVKTVKEQLQQWYHVMADPRIDGFNGWGCKKKCYEVLFELQKIMDNAPTYAGEEEWLEEKKQERVQAVLEGKAKSINYVPQESNVKNKIIGFLFVTVMISGCANFKDYVPEDFDGNEYMKLAELSVLSDLSESCNGMEMASMRFNSAVLMKYSEGTLKENIAEIYAGIHDLTVELTERENP